MLNRLSTLRNDDAKVLVPTTASYGKESAAKAREVQNRILYEGNPSLIGTCIVCSTVCNTYGDHYVSAVYEGLPRFRGNRLLATNHPMNMVACCKNSQCNCEAKKLAVIGISERHKNYYDYVLENCPTVNITRDDYKKLDDFNIKMCEERMRLIKKVKNDATAVYVEDIDS